ncbi:hypothetical protein R5R35_014447, partial [Gryllus longicercus]
FAEVLVKSSFPRVCTLHRGIQVLRSANILVVPGAM